MRKLLLASFSLVIGASILFASYAYALVTPTNLVASTISPTSINLTWTAVNDASGYSIYRNSTSAPIATTTATSWLNTGLTPATAYTYYIAAYSATTTSAISNAVIATTSADTILPSTPTNLTAQTLSTTAIKLNWTASTDNVAVAKYKIYRNNSLVATTSLLTYTDSGLTASTTYNYSLSAVDTSNLESIKTATITATTLITPDTTVPSAPSNVTGAALSTTSIKLNWTAASDNAGIANYKIYRNNSYIANTAGLTYTDTGLSANTSYKYNLTAVDISGLESAKTATTTVKTLKTQSSTTTSGVLIEMQNGYKDRKLINRRANQIVKIIVYGNANFNVNDLKNNTAIFGGAKAYGWTSKDVNRDGKRDRIYTFRSTYMKDIMAGDKIVKFTVSTKSGSTLTKDFVITAKNAPKRPEPKKVEKKIEKKIEKVNNKIENVKTKIENQIQKLQDKLSNLQNATPSTIIKAKPASTPAIINIHNDINNNGDKGYNKNDNHGKGKSSGNGKDKK